MTLRDDIRDGFDRQQARLGEVGDARHRLMHGALAAREVVSRRVQWIAGIAAVLIAALVISTFAWVRSNLRPTVPGVTPRANASPTPLQNVLHVLDSTPLILYRDAANVDQLDGVTWDGKTSGRVGLSVGIGNPQGTLYETDHDIRNRAGAVLETFDITVQQPFFADDGVHYCDTVRTKPRDVSGPGVLETGTIGQAPRYVATVGVFGAAQMQGGGPRVIACSPASNRAVVYQAPPGGVGVVHVWVIQLSTGHTLWATGSGAWIAASHDGRLVALSPALGQPTKVYGENGAVAATVPDEVFAFSWDGSLAVVAPISGGRPSIIDWRNGRTIWTCPGGTTGLYAEAFAEPDGMRLAVGVLDPSYVNSGWQPVELFVVGPDGVTVFEKVNVSVVQQY